MWLKLCLNHALQLCLLGRTLKCTLRLLYVVTSTEMNVGYYTTLILCYLYVPFMSKWVKLPIQLTHGDGLGIEDKCVDQLKRYTSRGTLALEGREGISKHFIALGLAGDGRTNQHETVTHNCGLIELNALFHKTQRMNETNYTLKVVDRQKIE